MKPVGLLFSAGVIGAVFLLNFNRMGHADEASDDNLTVRFEIYGYDGGYSTDKLINLYVNGVQIKGELLPNDALNLRVLPGSYEIIAIVPEQYAGIAQVDINSDKPVETLIELKSGLLGKALQYNPVQLNNSEDVTEPVSFGFQSNSGYAYVIEELGSIEVTPIEAGSFSAGFGGGPIGRTQLLNDEFVASGPRIDTSRNKEDFDQLLLDTFGTTEFQIQIEGVNPTFGTRLFGLFYYKVVPET